MVFEEVSFVSFPITVTVRKTEGQEVRSPIKGSVNPVGHVRISGTGTPLVSRRTMLGQDDPWIYVSYYISLF